MKNKPRNRRKQLFANRMHRDIFLIVFLASSLPVIIATFCLYYLIFNVTASQVGFPETIAYHIIPAARKVTAILLVSVPISILAILIIAYKIAHKIVGPFDRIVRELDEHLEHKREGHIILRRGDKFLPLAERINKLLDRIKK